ncbi:MAG: sulfurtransferase TusA [Gammaproteobacteria bacterium]|nr:sulfurtransferase TusA [Gammaproteobacteria bacterium]
MPSQELDARGLLCPEPLMLARNRLRGMGAGDILFIRATDPSTVRDFANLCRFMGHEMVDQSVIEAEFRFWIRRA